MIICQDKTIFGDDETGTGSTLFKLPWFLFVGLTELGAEKALKEWVIEKIKGILL